MENGKAKNNILSESLVIFLIPIYGYILLYAFEYGYFIRLGIPIEFIEVNLSALAKISAFLYFASTFLLGLLDIIYKLVIHGKAVAIKILKYLYFLSISFLPTIAFDIWKVTLPWVIFAAFLCIISELVYPLTRYKNIKGYWKKVEQQYKDDAKHYEEDIGDVIIKRVGYKSFQVVFFLISFTYISFSIGAISAKNQELFLVLKSDPELVLLRKYPQTYLCSEFDRNKKELLNKFSLHTVDQVSERGYTISREKIGPLSKKIIFGKNID
jgi:hypothetical protein